MITPAYAATPGGAFPPFDATWAVSTLFWLAVVFGALYWLMSRRGLPQVEGILAERAKRIAGDLALAAGAQKQAEEASKAYDEAVAKARADAQAIAGKARDEASAAADAKRREVEADLFKRLAAAEATIAESKAAAMANVDGIAAETAAVIVERLTGKAPDAAAVRDAMTRA
jgi:F-type H+-transporting ATPase subunit b